MKLKLLFIISLVSLHSFAQEFNPIICVGKVISYELDTTLLKKLHIEDSIRKSKENISILRLENPFIVEFEVIKVFTEHDLRGKIKIRVWSHTIPEAIKVRNPRFQFILSEKDSLNTYSYYNYGQVFKNWRLQWAEPVIPPKIYCELKKPLIKNKLMRKTEAKYYQLLKDEANLCFEQLEEKYKN